MKIKFVEKLSMSKSNKVLLVKVNSIIDDYRQQGYKLTLRQLYYQLVSKNVVPNDVKEYDKLSNLITKGRLAGIVDWFAIEDRTRVPYLPYFNDSPADAILDAERHYRLDRQEGQLNYIELWVEKDALSNVLKRKTSHYHLQLMVNRGYSSTTAMFDSYLRFIRKIEYGQKTHLLYLGDHDPSGLDMIRDINDRMLRMLVKNDIIISSDVDQEELMEKHCDAIDDYLSRNAGNYVDGYISEEERGMLAYIIDHFTVKQIGLTTEQVRQYNPPPNPAKIKDPRAVWYIKNFGGQSWEVDALNPEILHQIIDRNVMKIIDLDDFEKKLKQEDVDRAELRLLPEVNRKFKAITDIVKEFQPAKEKDSKVVIFKSHMDFLNEIKSNI